jgi:hypothetical protein
MKSSTIIREHMRRDRSSRGSLARGIKLVGIQALANEEGPRGIRNVLRPIVPEKSLNKHMVGVNKALKEIEVLSHSSTVVIQDLRRCVQEQVMGGGLCDEV